MIKLSEQYERHITKLNEAKSEKAVPPGGEYGYTPDPTTVKPSGSAADPTQWIKYSAIGLSVLALIFGKSAMLKLFGRKLINQQGKVTRYNVYRRLKDKKALRDAGITKDEMRDIWIKFQKHIQEEDQKLIQKTINSIKKGEITAKEGLKSITHLLPKGEKNLEYRTLLGFEKIAIAKKAKKAAATFAPVQAPITTKPTTPSWYTSTTTKPAAKAPAIVRGYTDPITKITYPNLTQKQVEEILASKFINRKIALNANPALTYTQLQRY